MKNQCSKGVMNILWRIEKKKVFLLHCLSRYRLAMNQKALEVPEFTKEESVALIEHICEVIDNQTYWAYGNSEGTDEKAEYCAELFRNILDRLVGANNSQKIYDAYLKRVKF